MRPSVSRLADDPYLEPYRAAIRERRDRALALEQRLTGQRISLAEFANGHNYFGLHRQGDGWVFRDWAPHAEAIHLVGTFTGWEETEAFALRRINAHGEWELRMDAAALRHGDLYRLRMRWPGGDGERIPAYARRVVQDGGTQVFSAQVWSPEEPYAWRHPAPPLDRAPLVYEAHVGMAQQREGMGTYGEFRENILPRVAAAGYNTLQLMAVMEHPYYGSFGYHVSSFFAASSRFGTPEELKALVDAAHGAGLRVTMDLVHSHAVNNEAEGLARFDGTPYQYFHDGARGYHAAWDSRCFDYGKVEVIHFLMSNCRFWLEEYHFDGFRFDGVTSMLYLHHGMGPPFTSYNVYFDASVDEDALAYLTLANKLIHGLSPQALTVAEDVSGMPGLGAPAADGGCGFDCRLAMGVPDCWFKLIRDVRDEDWNLGYLWQELTNRRADERTISYAECHDQAIVGGKTVFFQLVDAAMYTAMREGDRDVNVDRGIALHKMIRLATLGSAGHGYLNFIGNEFGHPEWIDFPREGNGWSYHYARRQWHLRDSPELKYRFLADFDRAMLELVNRSGILDTCEPRLRWIHGDDKTLVFERGPLVFAFNFHPSRSVTDCGVETTPGEYVLALDSDEGRFGGFDRLTPAQRYPSAREDAGGGDRHVTRLYLPARVALVLQRIPAMA